VVHNKENIQKMKIAAKLAAETATHGSKVLKEGLTGEDVDKEIHDFIIKNGGYPTPIGFMGFPKSVCISPNEVMCHGIPNMRPFQNGDYVNLDISVYVNGVHGDTSLMVQVGNVHPDVQKLIKVTQQAVYQSIKMCKPGVQFSAIGEICEDIAKEHGFHSSELFTGHGIGELLHMPPMITHTYNNYPGEMQVGNVFTIEPIITMYPPEQILMWKDKWTVVSQNNPSAQWEHTVLITENGFEVLTKREGEVIE